MEKTRITAALVISPPRIITIPLLTPERTIPGALKRPPSRRDYRGTQMDPGAGPCCPMDQNPQRLGILICLADAIITALRD